MTNDDSANDSPKKTPPTTEEVAEYEQAVRRLIRFRAPFDPQMQFLRDLLDEKDERGY